MNSGQIRKHTKSEIPTEIGLTFS